MASVDIPFVRLRTATALDSVLIDILVPIGDVVISLRVLVKSVDILSGRSCPLIAALIVILVLLFFLLRRSHHKSFPFLHCLDLEPS